MQWSLTQILLLLRLWSPPNCSMPSKTRILSCPECSHTPMKIHKTQCRTDHLLHHQIAPIDRRQCRTVLQVIETSRRLPFMATEILCCECHHLTEMIFQTETSDLAPALFCELLSFLDCEEHYLLAGYFSKVMINLTKRVFSPTHKHNLTLCRQVFERGMLLKSCNHMYSGSTNEYVIKWLTLKA